MSLLGVVRFRVCVHSTKLISSQFGRQLLQPLGIKMADHNPTIVSSPDGMDVAAMRKKYKTGHEAFVEDHLVAKEPIEQFTDWFKTARQLNGIEEANAMTLATATKDGRPSARWVLLKGYGKEGFKFYTNYESRKSKELLENPFACLVFYWAALSRSVRIEGRVEKLSEEESTQYFHSRPFDSQIGACVSHQSTVIESRDVLTTRDAELKEQYKDKTVPKPDYWGGFIVIPEVVEFWQGQSNRLHDRIVFRRPKDGETPDGKLLHQGDDGWVYTRLSP
ncbi:pyridoxine/pyridoxamine 5'-phosphate oxidase-like [Amphiura filiformis]|uniref:pyridoxine/pyridoxamine 5'-phosphate oxidase-like n=1 Tax=Amphiura filiformis TaxID=82378 RepID=UPI003B2211F6